jgi:hypothetical protein
MLLCAVWACYKHKTLLPMKMEPNMGCHSNLYLGARVDCLLNAMQYKD